LVGTGDELVPPASLPLAFQIRQSNIQAIQAEATVWGTPAATLATLTDDPDEQAKVFQELLDTHDAVVATGGVSLGIRDSVPRILKRMGIQEVFHKVAQKPGKPLWFGVSKAGHRVFGLPGNPVSSLVTFRRYVLPAFLAQEGIAIPAVGATLGAWTSPGTELTHFVLGRIQDGHFIPGEKAGSGDLRPMALSSGFAQIDPGTHSGLKVPFFPWGTPGGWS
jgi:molybdopterin molybdotransferase